MTMTLTRALNMTVPLEIGIGCDDLASMRQFYEGTLGMHFVGEARVPAATAQRFCMARGALTVVRLQTHYGERIKLIGLDEPPQRERHRAARVFDDTHVLYLTFIITNIASTLERLLAGGAIAISGADPIESRPGLQIAFVRDPEGNVLELVQYDDVAAYRPDLAHP